MTDASPPRTFPSWKEIYSAQPVETMPWFYDKLDPDLAQALATRSITHGKLLDLGTGPATQAIELARSGFTVLTQHETVYQGTLQPQPIALFTVLQRI